jgi:hypothetical protein
MNILNKLYEEAVVKYKDIKRGNNYIPAYIKRNYNQVISNEEIYKFIFNIKNDKCPICGKGLKFWGFGKGFSKTCSVKCGHSTEQYREKFSQSTKGKQKSTRGKTYKEIYGTSNPSCGFKCGNDNIAKSDEIKKKISKGVKLSYTDELRNMRRMQAYRTNFISGHYKKNKPDRRGNFYRSSLEVKFSNLLLDNNIEFEYEKHIKLLNNHIKIVDFIIDDKIFIEISGYAYEKWQSDFISKMKLLRKSIDKNAFIYIITYNDKQDIIFEDISKNKLGDNIFISSIDDDNRILKTLNFIRDIIKNNKELECIK